MAKKGLAAGLKPLQAVGPRNKNGTAKTQHIPGA